MNRYFFYMLALTIIGNATFFVTRILTDNRYSGSVSSLLLAIPVGMIMLYLFVKAISKFPNKGLPEIMKETRRPWLIVGINLYFSLHFFSAGILILMVFSDIAQRFINPEITHIQAISLFLILVLFISRMKSTAIMYTAEMILIICIPFILFIISKTLASEYLWIDAMLEVATYVWEPPSWESLVAATYVFSGFSHMIIFNKYVDSKIKGRYYVGLLLLFIVNLTTTFFIPIGLQGSEAVGEYVYPWFASADSTRFQYGFIERVLFLFLGMYMMVAVVLAVVYWHIGLRLMLQVIPKVPSFWNSISEAAMAKWVILLFFSICTLGFEYRTDESELYNFGQIWFSVRFAGEVALIVLLFIVGRRKSDETIKL